jgi:hypothetical protein
VDVRLQGILPAEITELQAISGEQLHKLAKVNDIWALVAVLIESPDDSKLEQYMVMGIPPEIQDVIHDSNLEQYMVKGIPPEIQDVIH